MDMYTAVSQCYVTNSTLYTNVESVYSATDYLTEQMPFYQHGNQWDTPGSCLDSLKHRLVHNGSACSPYGQLLSLLGNEDALRAIGAKPLNALLRQVSLSPLEVSEVKLLKRRLRKRLAKRGWDSKERTRDQIERDTLRQLGEERENLRTERELLLREIQDLEALLKN